MGTNVILPGGVAAELSDEQLRAEAGAGTISELTPISRGQAQEMGQRQSDKQLADEHLDNTDKAIFGGFSGLSMGLGPAGLAKIMEGMGNKDAPLLRHLYKGAQQDGAYTLGQAAGLGLGGVLTGGAVDEAAAASQLGRFMPEAEGIVGGVIRGAATGGARAGIEGGLMGLGSAVEDSVLSNKRLTAEALLAKMGEGALVGGGLGSVLGAVGGGVRGAFGKGGTISSAMKAAGMESASELGMLREMGANGSVLRQIGSMEGGMGSFLSEAERGLESEGLKLSSKPHEILAAAERLHTNAGKLKIDVAKQFDKAATAGAPSWSQFANRVREELMGELAMAAAPGAPDMAMKLGQWLDRAAPSETAPVGHGFEGWVRGRALYEKVPGLPEQYAQRVRAIYDDELRQAMLKAENLAPELKGAAGRYQAMELTEKTSEILKTMAEFKNSINMSRGVVRGDDLGAAAAYAMSGHPISGIGYSVGRVAMRSLAEQYGPAMAEAVYKMSMGAKGTGAINELASKIGSGLEGFFKMRNRGVTGLFLEKNRKLTRETFDKELDRAYKMVQASPEERLQYYARETGSVPLAKAMADASANAAAHLSEKLPASQKVKQGMSLRPLSKSVGIKPDEHKFLRSWGIVKNPMAALDDLQKGRLNKDSVDTLKAVWPEVHQMVVAQAQDKIAEMKASGQTMDVQGITQLSILLGVPLDRTLEKSFIEPVQMALAEPKAPPPAPKPGPTPDGSSEEYKTAAEEAMS